MLQVYNEERFMVPCLEHLREHGIDAYVIDNESEDRTRELAERYLDNGVVGIETLPREGCFALRAQCQRQEELAADLDADWLIHYDADEFRGTPQRGQSMSEAIREADEAGFNAINFLEFTFVPTHEHSDHDHPRFRETMRWYYPFLPVFPHRMNAWKRQDGPVELAFSAGHQVRFPGLKMSPRSLYLRHYLYLSRGHALEKFVRRSFAEDEVKDGWFGFRAHISADMIQFPSESQLRVAGPDYLLDPSDPLKRHLLEDVWREMQQRVPSSSPTP